METIYLKIKVNKTDTETEKLRNAGLFFTTISEALQLDRRQIIEIEQNGFKKLSKKHFQKNNDKSRSDKKGS